MKPRRDEQQLSAKWIDRGREATQPPNPEYPNGVDIDLTGGDKFARSCKIKLPYPAKRCGYYVVACGKCGMRVIATTAGRPDDPRSATLVCKRRADA